MSKRRAKTTQIPTVGRVIRATLPSRSLGEHPAVIHTLDCHETASCTDGRIDVLWTRPELLELSKLASMRLMWEKERDQVPIYYRVGVDGDMGVSRSAVEKWMGVLPRGEFHNALVLEVKETSFVVTFEFDEQLTRDFYGHAPFSISDHGNSWRLFRKRPRGPAPEGNVWDAAGGRWMDERRIILEMSLRRIPWLPCVGDTPEDDVLGVIDSPPDASVLPKSFDELAGRWAVVVHRRKERLEATKTGIATRMADEILTHVELYGVAPDAETQNEMRRGVVAAVQGENTCAGNWRLEKLEQFTDTCTRVIEVMTMFLPLLEATIDVQGGVHRADVGTTDGSCVHTTDEKADSPAATNGATAAQARDLGTDADPNDAIGPMDTTNPSTVRTVLEAVAAAAKVLLTFTKGINATSQNAASVELLTRRLASDPHHAVTTDEVSDMRRSARHAQITKVHLHDVAFRHVATLAAAVAHLPVLFGSLKAAEATFL